MKLFKMFVKVAFEQKEIEKLSHHLEMGTFHYNNLQVVPWIWSRVRSPPKLHGRHFSWEWLLRNPYM